MPPTKKGRKGGRTKAGRKKKEASVEIESDKYLFDRQEMILCYHGPMIYKAKILKRTISPDSVPMYFVHYHGWNSQWDEWVAPQRCLKYSAENIEKQKEAEKSNKNKNKNKEKNNNKINNKTQKKNKRQIIEDSEDSDSEQERNKNNDNNTNNTNNKDKQFGNDKDEYLESLILKKKELKKKDLDDLDLNKKIKIHEIKKENKKYSENKKRERKNNKKQRENEYEKKEKERISRRKFKDKLETITIPLILKDNLVEQYNLIHYDEKLIKLPKINGLTINNILNDVLIDQKNKLQQKKENKNIDPTDLSAAITINEILPIIINGIRGFFKNTLKINLLYNFEKPQFEMLSNLNNNNNDTDYCDIYGAEHLIRLFYILPNILIHTNGVNQSNFGQIKQCVSIILQFLAKNKTKYLKDYNIDENVTNVDEKYIAKTKQIAKKYDNKH